MSKEEQSKTKQKRPKKKSLLIGIFVSVICVGLMVFVVSKQSKSKQLVDASNHSLEQYVLEKYIGDKNVHDIVFGFSNVIAEEDLYIVDFNHTEDYVDSFEKENFAGVIEFNEVNHVYHFANGQPSSDAPRVDEYTRRVPILYNTESNQLPVLYTNVFYNVSDELEVDTSYFLGESDYAIVQQEDAETGAVVSIHYVTPQTYEHISAEVVTSVVKDFELEEVTIGDVGYLRYEIEVAVE